MINKTENKKIEDGMHYGADAFSFRNAEKLRIHQTDAESILWAELRNKKLDGIKFRRQHPVSRFVVDFYCHSAKLVVELDGGIHQNAEVMENDKNRQMELEEFGLRVLRFKNEEVFSHKENVLAIIRNAIQSNNNSK